MYPEIIIPSSRSSRALQFFNASWLIIVRMKITIKGHSGIRAGVNIQNGGNVFIGWVHICVQRQRSLASNCHFPGHGDNIGVKIDNLLNITLISVTISESDVGIFVNNCSTIALSEINLSHTSTGISIHGSETVNSNDISISEVDGPGLCIVDSNNVDIQSTHIHNVVGVAMYLEASENVDVYIPCLYMRCSIWSALEKL